MKYLKLFEEFNPENLSTMNLKIFLELGEDDILSIIDSDEDTAEYDDYYKETAVETIAAAQEYLKGKNEIILYRILDLPNVDDLKKEFLGTNFVYNKNLFNKDFLFEIGLGNAKPENLYIVTIKTPVENINFEDTILHNINYPHEKEINLNANNNLEILSVKHFKKGLIS
jgi:hypothetical protein